MIVGQRVLLYTKRRGPIRRSQVNSNRVAASRLRCNRVRNDKSLWFSSGDRYKRRKFVMRTSYWHNPAFANVSRQAGNLGFGASGTAFARFGACLRCVDGISEIFRHWQKRFMKKLVGLADETSMDFCGARTSSDVAPAGTRREPVSRTSSLLTGGC